VPRKGKQVWAENFELSADMRISFQNRDVANAKRRSAADVKFLRVKCDGQE